MTVTQQATFATRYPLFMQILVFCAWGIGAVILYDAVRLEVYSFGGSDAHAYWLAAQAPLAYTRPPGGVDAFLYSPLFADVIRPFGLLPWPLFLVGWTVLEAAALVWLVKPLGLRWGVPLGMAFSFELVNGNIYTLLAVAAVLGMRYPAAWCFPILTKVVSGVGLLWFAARGEWRRLAVGVGSVAALVGGSYLLQPSDWQGWVRLLLGETGGSRDGQGGLLARCIVAVVVVLFAARAGRPWLVAVAMVVCNPIYGWTTLAMLAAIPRLQAMNLTATSVAAQSLSTVSPASRSERTRFTQ